MAASARARSALALALSLALVARAAGQFGTLGINWEQGSTGSKPRLAEDKSITHRPARDVRRTALASLPMPQLQAVAASLKATCDSCVTAAHWVAHIRGTCLEASPKALKAHLSKRGVKCAGCTMREHYLDRLLDSVHLPVR